MPKGLAAWLVIGSLVAGYPGTALADGDGVTAPAETVPVETSVTLFDDGATDPTAEDDQVALDNFVASYAPPAEAEDPAPADDQTLVPIADADSPPLTATIGWESPEPKEIAVTVPDRSPTPPPELEPYNYYEEEVRVIEARGQGGQIQWIDNIGGATIRIGADTVRRIAVYTVRRDGQDRVRILLATQSSNDGRIRYVNILDLPNLASTINGVRVADVRYIYDPLARSVQIAVEDAEGTVYRRDVGNLTAPIDLDRILP